MRPLLGLLVPVAATALSWLVPAAVSAVSFQEPIPIAVQDSPLSVVIADFDGGGSDFSVANVSSQSLSFVRGHGDGTFDTPVHLALGAPTHVVRAAHLDGDANLDLVATLDLGPSLVEMLAGDGMGGFAPPVGIGSGGTFPTALVAADLDGDGDDDLAAAIAGQAANHAGSVAVLLNQGGGDFTETFHQVTDVEVVYGADLSGADLDGDGDVDLVVTLDLIGFNKVMVNDGSGSFTPGPDLPMTDLGVANALGDIDGDQDVDVVLLALSGTMWSFRNDGTGSFAAPEVYTAPATVHIVGRFTMADMDGDVRPELILPAPAFSEPGIGIAVAVNDGTGRFDSSEGFPAEDATVPTAAATGDLDGMWPPDVVCVDRGADLAFVFLGAATASSPLTWEGDATMRAHPLPLHAGASLHLQVVSPSWPEAGAVLEIFDPAGRAIRTLAGSERGSRWELTWDGRDRFGRQVPAGVYVALARAGSRTGRIKIPVYR